MPAIHHLNFVVPDLDAAARQFELVLGVAPGPVEYLSGRQVSLRRFELDGTWLVLVCPTTDDSPAAEWLQAHGPGLFLVSFEAGSLRDRLAALAEDGIAQHGPTRRGLDDWQVADLDPAAFFGIPVQLTQTTGNKNAGDKT
ncbi:MAG: VOC family protein [Pseudomonadota bacterium]